MSWFRGGSARPLIVLGLLELAFLAALGWWPEAGVPFPRLALLAGAFAAYWGVAFAAFDERADTRLIWGFAILFRVVLLPCVPFLSDDIYRYLWDGHVQLAGINPYLYPPDAPELESHSHRLARAHQQSLHLHHLPALRPGGLRGGRARRRVDARTQGAVDARRPGGLSAAGESGAPDRAARWPGPSSCLRGRRCWWSRRPGADTSSPSASSCSWSWLPSPCPRAGRPGPPPTPRPRPTPVPSPATPTPAPPARASHRGPGRRGRWGPCWPWRP